MRAMPLAESARVSSQTGTHSNPTIEGEEQFVDTYRSSALAKCPCQVQELKTSSRPQLAAICEGWSAGVSWPGSQ
jgi:hypothetical protein